MSNNILPSLQDIETLHDLISGRAVAASIYVAAKLGIADQLISNPQNCQQLASTLRVNAAALYRLMRALAGIGVFFENADHTFSLTPLGSAMRSDIQNSMRSLIIMCGDRWHWDLWGGLAYTIENGKPFFPKNFNTDFYTYMQKNPEVKDSFNAAMTSLSSLNNYAIVQSYDFSSVQTIIDIGGGEGSLLASILKAHPHCNAILYDIPPVINRAKSYLETLNVADRCRLIEGDFFKEVPGEGSIYIVKHVLHGLGLEQSISMLKKIREKIPSSGKLLVIEMLIPDKNLPSYSKFNDIEMMLLSEAGRERTQEEFEVIFAKSGFDISALIPVQMGIYIIEGVPKEHQETISTTTNAITESA